MQRCEGGVAVALRRRCCGVETAWEWRCNSAVAAFCLCNELLFSCYIVWNKEPPIDTGDCSAPQLARHREISTTR